MPATPLPDHLLVDDIARAAVDVLDLPCPGCEAAVGEDCWADEPHLDRIELADVRTDRAVDEVGLAA